MANTFANGKQGLDSYGIMLIFKEIQIDRVTKCRWLPVNENVFIPKRKESVTPDLFPFREGNAHRRHGHLKLYNNGPKQK